MTTFVALARILLKLFYIALICSVSDINKVNKQGKIHVMFRIGKIETVWNFMYETCCLRILMPKYTIVVNTLFENEVEIFERDLFSCRVTKNVLRFSK